MIYKVRVDTPTGEVALYLDAQDEITAKSEAEMVLHNARGGAREDYRALQATPASGEYKAMGSFV